jgi:hypothetical protein
MRRAGKLRPGEISQAAVARVIADYLKIEGTLDANDEMEYRKLKDRVYRALTGKAMTQDTLAWFTCAFALSREDARRVWSGFTGARPDQVDGYIGELLIPPPQAAAFSPPGFVTRSLREKHEIGGDRRPKSHTVAQQIQAIEEWGWRYPVRFDSRIAKFEVINESGGTSDLYRCDASFDAHRSDKRFFAVDIILPRPVPRGETALIEYKLTYDPSIPVDRIFQRGALQNMQDIEIEVCFSRNRLPKAVWWTHWREFGSEAPPYLREPMHVDARTPSVRKKLTSADRTIVGFSWRWPED